MKNSARAPIVKYILKRTVVAIPLILGVIAVNFLIIHLAPGDPILMFLGEEPASPELVQRLTEQFGLDKPIYMQLLIYLRNTFSGDLGYSYTYSLPVVTLIMERLPYTLLLMATALVLACAIGIPLGVISAVKRNSLVDGVISVLTLTGYAMPSFWLGMLLILLFSFVFPIFPTGGTSSLTGLTGINYVIDLLSHLFLPALTLSVWYLAMIARMTRSNMINVLQQNYIKLARSIGLDEKAVIFKHAFRGSLLSLITIIGTSLGHILAGALLIETVFSWPGLGRLMWESFSRRDYPVMMSLLLLSAIMVIVTNLATDILYAYVDPRIRYR